MFAVDDVLKTLSLDDSGKYENNFYILPIKDSDEYAKLYTLLDEKAVNTEYPSFEKSSTWSLLKSTSYFEIAVNNIDYMIFLIANFSDDLYYLKIGEKK